MKKSSFVAMILGTVSGVLFALGMCMALVEQWSSMKQGIIVGSVGLVLAIITVFVWRKMEHKPKIKLSAKTVGIILLSLIGSIVFGIGMCLVLVWNNLVYGIVTGLAGILILMCLIPISKGLK